MTRRTRLIWCGLAVLASAALLMGNRGQAALDEDMRKVVQPIADAVKKGDAATAQKLAEKTKSIDDFLYEAMLTFKPRNGKYNAFGVGKEPGKIMPDGIEKKVQQMAKTGVQNLPAEAEALEEMAYRINALAQIAKQYKPSGSLPLWNKYVKEMDEYSLEFAKAAKGGNADNVKKAAAKMDANCNQCHEKFR